MAPEYRDNKSDTPHRDFSGYTKEAHHVNNSGRHDIVGSKVAPDGKNLFHWVDKAPVGADSRNWCLQGDSAPDGRFNYRFQSGF